MWRLHHPERKRTIKIHRSVHERAIQGCGTIRWYWYRISQSALHALGLHWTRTIRIERDVLSKCDWCGKTRLIT